MKPASLHTLSDKYAYQQVFSHHSYKSGNRYFLLLARAVQCLDHECMPVHSRVGIIVSRKNVRNASRRNLVKRIVRESFRQKVNYPESLQHTRNHLQANTSEPVHQVFDCVFLARSAIHTLHKKKLADLLGQAWIKLMANI